MSDITSILGLSRNDKRVYDALLHLGKAKTGAIITRSGVTSSRVYASLSKLVTHGLVSSIVKNNIRYYQPEPPTQLLDETVLRAKSLEAFIRNFTISQPKNTSDRITLYEGNRGYKQAFLRHMESAPERSKLLIIGYGSLYRTDTDIRTFFATVDEKMTKKRCTAEMIIDKTLLSVFKKDRKRKALYTFKSVPSRYLSAMAVNISDTEVMFTIIGEHPIALCIRDTSIVDAFKKYFRLLWETGQDVPKNQYK